MGRRKTRWREEPGGRGGSGGERIRQQLACLLACLLDMPLRAAVATGADEKTFVDLQATIASIHK
eukprot:755898-Hanusia_phi.AAC.1